MVDTPGTGGAAQDGAAAQAGNGGDGKDGKDNDFASALRQASAEKAASKGAGDANARGGNKDDDEPPAGKGSAETAAAAGKGKSDEGADGKGAKSAEAGAETAAGKTAPKSAPNTAAIVVDWSKVDPAVKAAYDAGTPETKKALEAVVRGNLQRGQQIAELKTKLSQRNGRRAPGSTTGNPSKLKSSAAAMRGAFESTAVKALAADAPEAVEAMRAALEPVISATEESAKMLEGIAADDQVADVELQEAILAEVHPDWETVTSSPEFDAWAKSAPQYIRDAIVANSKATEQFPQGRLVDGEQAAMVLSAFKSSLTTKGNGDEPPAPGRKPGEGSEATSPLEGRRQRQRESAESPAPRGAAALSGPSEDDFAGALRQATREKERERRGRAARSVA
jgi:hypothetical protein